MKTIKGGLLTAFLLLFSFALLAQEAEPTGEESIIIADNPENELFIGEATGGGAISFVRPIIALSVVIALLYGLFYLFRRLARPKGQQSEVIQVLATKNLTNQTAVHIVEIEGKLFILSSGEDIHLIKEIEAGEYSDSLKLTLSRNNEQTKSFAQLIGDKLRENNLEFKRPNRNSLDEQQKRLRDLTKGNEGE
ncbi:MAG: flagellar biosynthetic protein FliO [Spirochaetaceae bacterium]|nr:flagellar biosynthetic protein FliO [Spirochaetaceae bacterium]